MIKNLWRRTAVRVVLLRVVLAGCCTLGCLSAGLSYGAGLAGPTPDPSGQSAARAAKFVEVAGTPETLRQLRAGGYALYLRHGATDNSKSDRVPAVDLADCSTQRPLTEAGRQMAAGVGSAPRGMDMALITSPAWRQLNGEAC